MEYQNQGMDVVQPKALAKAPVAAQYARNATSRQLARGNIGLKDGIFVYKIENIPFCLFTCFSFLRWGLM